MSVWIIIFIVFTSVFIIVFSVAYYSHIDIYNRQDDAETKKQYLMGLIPGYWWYIDFLEWKKDFVKNWRELK